MIAKGGRVFVAISAAAAAILLPVNATFSIGFAVLTGFFIFVFRDPKRTVGSGVVSPADGVVRQIDPEKGLVSIYLSLSNVHVTRAPISGSIEKVTRYPGKHLPAYSHRSPNNERIEMEMDTKIGPMSIMHMSGILARRIVPYIEEGHTVSKGKKLALIRFGSRVDLFLPPTKVVLKAVVGQKVRAGMTCIAEVLDERTG
ncbi:MAG: phosphatidylserine decarboxylase [Thermoplasmata archaeon]|nr:phosphatidylserine decarboxylase [Thermoplasmata archaeon]